MTSKEDFRHISVQDRQSVIAYLKAVTEGIERGNLTLRAENEELRLSPSGLLELEVRSSRKSGRVKLALKFSWREGEGEAIRRGLEIEAEPE